MQNLIVSVISLPPILYVWVADIMLLPTFILFAVILLKSYNLCLRDLNKIVITPVAMDSETPSSPPCI